MGLFVITIKSLGNSLFGIVLTETVFKGPTVDSPVLVFAEIWFSLREKSETDLIFIALRGHVWFFHPISFLCNCLMSLSLAFMSVISSGACQ